MKSFDPVRYKRETIIDWETRAERYHSVWVHKHVGPLQATVKLVDALDIHPDDLVLDLACGTGGVAKEISTRLTGSGRIIGIDLSRTALSIAKSSISLSNKCFIEMDVEKIGIQRPFDKVSCQFALMFFPNPKRVMRDVRKAMTTQAKVAVAVHGARDKVPYLDAIMNPITKYVPNAESFVAHKFGHADDLLEVLVDAGFTKISIHSYVFQYQLSDFDEYWSEYFSVACGGEIRKLIFSKGTRVISAIKSEARKIASLYTNNDVIRFPWEVLIAIGHCS